MRGLRNPGGAGLAGACKQCEIHPHLGKYTTKLFMFHGTILTARTFLAPNGCASAAHVGTRYSKGGVHFFHAIVVFAMASDRKLAKGAPSTQTVLHCIPSELIESRSRPVRKPGVFSSQPRGHWSNSNTVNQLHPQMPKKTNMLVSCAHSEFCNVVLEICCHAAFWRMGSTSYNFSTSASEHLKIGAFYSSFPLKYVL